MFDHFIVSRKYGDMARGEMLTFLTMSIKPTYKVRSITYLEIIL